MSSGEWNAIRLSLQVATIAVAVSLPCAIGVAWVLAKRKWLGRTLLETVVNLPLVLPPVVTGYLLMIGFWSTGVMGGLLDVGWVSG